MESNLKGKRKRFSRKNKRDWRKHSNIKDIEDFLEEQRLEERTGGLVADKQDNDLFVVDTDSHTDKGELTKKDKYFFRNKPLRCYQNLESDSRIPPVPKAKPRGDKRNRKSNLPHLVRKENGIIPIKEMTKRAEAAADRQKKKDQMDQDDEKQKQPLDSYNLWVTGPKDDMPTKLKNADRHFMVYTKRNRKRVPSSYYLKPSKIPAVVVVDPGASYNPAYEDHQRLLKKVYKDEVGFIKDEKILETWCKGVKKWRSNELQENYLSEMSTGLFGDEQNEQTTEGAEEQDEDIPVPNPPATSESRKTQKQRRKQRIIKADESQRRADKREKVRANDVYRIKTIKRQFRKDDALTARKKKAMERKQERADAGTKRLGRVKFEDTPVSFQLSTELVGSLRQIKPEGSMLRDRYKNIQKRNIIEARTRKKGSKRNLKDYIKKEYKGIID